MERYERDEYINKRKYDIREINSRAYSKIESAYRRDAYYLKNLIDLEDNRPLSKEESLEIEEFWKPYKFAYTNDSETQRVFYRQSGTFDPSYIGFGLQRHSLVRFWNHASYATLRNKFYLPLLFPQVKHPQTFIANNYGVYISDGRVISKNEALSRLQSILRKEEVILKPSDESGSGTDIKFLHAGMSLQTLENYFNHLKENFLIQRILKNHSSYAAPYEKALNTLRIVTLIWKEKVMLVGTVFRMGNGDRVDNWGRGGLACPVDKNGICGNFAVTEQGKRVSIHPSGFRFAGHQLYKCAEAQELALTLHATLPQQKYISWDLTVDDKGDIVMIEMNTPGSSELLQAVGFNAYISKDIAKEIFDEYLIKRFFYNKANFDWNYREFSDHISLTKYAGISEKVIVPIEIEGKKISMLYDDALSGKNVKELIIPKGIIFNKELFLIHNPTCTCTLL